MDNIYGIINGDCDTIMDDLIAHNIKYDLILTDPPYNIKKDFGNNSDCLTIKEFQEVTKHRVEKIKKLLTPTGSIIWFGIHDYICYVQIAMYDAGLFYRRMNIWHYENGFSRSKKEPATHYEPFLWFSNSNNKWTYNVDAVRVPYKSKERLKNAVNYKNAKGEKKVWIPNPNGSMRGDIWDFPTLAGKRFENERTEHPTQKPESLITELIKAFCPMNSNVYNGKILDPFHGSGTLGVCCEKLNQQGHHIEWTGIELEKKWCEVAQQRITAINEGGTNE
jgi:site-specific DNA-methyltransferase (adenine-specific)